MTPALRTARYLTAAAGALTASAAYLGTVITWWAVLPCLYVAAVIAWCASCEYAVHRRTLTAHERARRAALLEELDTAGPCCRLYDLSGGYAHRDCARPPDGLAELYTACCAEAFVSRGARHDATCPTRTTRSNAA
ncbi:hypothetical protein ACIRF8_12710 [Streptomyces sp. NPDC102406]|uniref:hypothetical protein n=1 Tax=Streptomyces sp. NPDC102406 TaxID=3366171 RepID=UPI00382C6D9F